MSSQKLKTCFITGANSGIGKEAALQLAKKGFYVLMGVRNLQRGEAALEEIRERSKTDAIDLIAIDLSSKASILEAAHTIGQKIDSLDVLIHNAADFDITRKKRRFSVDGVESIWATNHIGPIILTNELMSLIKNSKQGRIITIASKGLVIYPKLNVDMADPEYNSRKFSVSKAYYQSKLAQIMYTYWLADYLSDTQITVNCLRVTNVKVDLDRFPDISKTMKFIYSLKSRNSISAEEMAKSYVYLACSNDLKGTTGKYFNEKNETVNSSSYSLDKRYIEEVMELSRRYI